MGRIVNSTFVSLDGVINHLDNWHFDYIDDESDAIALDQLEAGDAMVMGRRTYEIYSGAWSTRDSEYATKINAMRKYVVSWTLHKAQWTNTTVLSGDLVEAANKLKQAHARDILMHGYGPVAKTLMRAGLVDELCLWVHPVLAGVGTADDLLFGDVLHARLGLLETRTLKSGVVVLRYGPV
ncbi:dihydrofolate reductase family protein [Microlunatus sp. Gsoil 973]|uniref:dihydrofolate reductase family protein n=1 Tax=Microlunatus sp. Gsoil 973 TaxID=2672569 RepID=UPI0018A83A1F|nr:dihydrofolate reductase family protein [Microlunatus sp. Gsoil 973]